MECYSTPKRNELSGHEKTWRKLKGVLLSKRRQSEKAMSCQLHDTLEKAKPGRQKDQWLLGSGEWEWGKR